MSNPLPEKPNLDLIQMVQQARMLHDDHAKPSEITAVYWVEAKCQTATCQQPTPQQGQWVLNTTVQNVDAAWAAIKQATEDGQLGYKSKVSTASRQQNNPDSRTICVLTYDSTDESDVQRVHNTLKSLNIEGDWTYEQI